MNISGNRVAHFITWGFGCMITAQFLHSNRDLLINAVVWAAIGLLKETYDQTKTKSGKPRGTHKTGDVGADILGVMFATVIVWINS